MTSHPETRIAILDDYANISTPYFSRIPSTEIASFPQTLNPSNPSDFSKLKTQLQPYNVISTMRERTPFPSSLLESLPNLQLLLTTGMRNASIDLEAATKLNILVAGTMAGAAAVPGPDTTTSSSSSSSSSSSTSQPDHPPPGDYDSTNQHAWSLLLALTSRIPTDDRALKTRSSAWQSGLAIPLGGKVLGLVGFGRLGARMARTAMWGFGMKVVAWSANLTQQGADEVGEKVGLGKGVVRVVGKEEVFATADVVSLHYVLSARSRGIVGRKELEGMKPSALLLNTSRGPLVDEEALLEVLRKGGIRGVALDVFWEEPLSQESPWRKEGEFKSEVVLSPHMGYVNAGTMHRWYEEQAENVERSMNGNEVLYRMN